MAAEYRNVHYKIKPMLKQIRFSNHIMLLIAAMLVMFFTRCGSNHHDDHEYELKGVEFANENDSSFLVPSATSSLDFFPCSDCHSEMEPNAKRRPLVEMHDDIVFDHDSDNRWCLACHDLNERDSLRLASGKLLSFNESYKLCGQCHGPKIRDWKLGIHGKRTGMWNGKKEYRLCVNCHNPHSPKFESLSPMPPPLRPEQINMDSIKINKNEHEE